MTLATRAKAILDILATLSVICLAATLIWMVAKRSSSPAAPLRAAAPARRPEPPLPTRPIPIDGAERAGSPAARVALVEFTDFECPFCSAFVRDTLPSVQSDFIKTGKVLLVFRNLPLSSIHKSAEGAAIASQCAAHQGRFWEFHDRLFDAHGKLGDADLTKYATSLHLDLATFETCARRGMSRQLSADIALGKELGVSGTPTFFVGSVGVDGVKASARLTGARPYEDFRLALEAALLTPAAAGPRKD